MVIKQNHALMREEIALFFDLPAIPADNEQYDLCQTLNKGHVRIETRTLECITGRCEEWAWPGAVQGVRRTCERLVVKTGKRSVEDTYAVTSLSAADARATDLEAL